MLEVADPQMRQLVLPAVCCPGTGQRDQCCIPMGKLLRAMEGLVCATSLPALDSLHVEGCYSPAITNFTGQICKTKDLAELDLSVGF